MSGSDYTNTNWRDQLEDIRDVMHSNVEQAGGFVPNRHRRSNRSEKDYADRVKRASKAARSKFSQSLGDTEIYRMEPGVLGRSSCNGEYVTRSGDNGEEAPMSLNNENDDLSNDRGTNRKEGKHYSKSEGDYQFHSGHQNEEQLSPEEIAELERKKRINDRIRKGVIWTAVTGAVAAVAVGGIAVIAGFAGKHRSNIMNL